MTGRAFDVLIVSFRDEKGRRWLLDRGWRQGPTAPCFDASRWRWLGRSHSIGFRCAGVKIGIVDICMIFGGCARADDADEAGRQLLPLRHIFAATVPLSFCAAGMLILAFHFAKLLSPRNDFNGAIPPKPTHPPSHLPSDESFRRRGA